MPIWLFVVLAAISSILSIYKQASAMEMLRLITMVGVFYLVVNNFDRGMAVRLVGLVIILGAGMSLLGLAQYFLGLEHSWWKPDVFLASTYVNHNHFAGYLELAIPLAISMALVQRNKILIKVGLGTALMVMVAAFIFSQSRGGWASLAVSLIVMNIVLVRKKALRKESLIVFLLLIVLAVVYIYAGYDPVAERLGTVEQINNEGFIQSRLKIWRGTAQMIKNNLLFGTGIGTFIWGFPRYRPQGLNIRAHYAHNDYLHMMAEMGALAFPLILGMIWVVVNAGFSYQDRAQQPNSKPDFGLMEAAVLGSAVGILSLSLHGLVDFNFHITANMLAVSSLAAIIMRRG